MAVVFAMMSSYFLSRTLVPVMVQFFMRKDAERIIAEHEEEDSEFGVPGAESFTNPEASQNGHGLQNGAQAVSLLAVLAFSRSAMAI